jgi:hypothetical protein
MLDLQTQALHPSLRENTPDRKKSEFPENWLYCNRHKKIAIGHITCLHSLIDSSTIHKAEANLCLESRYDISFFSIREYSYSTIS